jgi:hypothetical protein
VALAIHGTPVNTHDNSGTTTTVSATITTTVATVLIAVVAPYHSGGSGPPTVTGVTGAGLTWTKRASNTYPNPTSGTVRVGLEVWWANAPSAVTAQAVQATLSSAPNTRLDIMVFAVSGSATPSAPWDTESSLPGKAQASGATPSNPTRSTTIVATNAMMLGFMAYGWNANAANTAGSGFTDILAPTTDNGLRNHWEYKLVTTGPNAFTVNFTGNQQFWTLITDALNGDVAAGATANGDTVTATASISASGAASATISAAGVTLPSLTTSISASGVASVADVADGDTVTVTASLIPGTASGVVNGTAPGDTITVTASLTAGAATSDGDADGDTVTATLSLIAGSASVDATADGGTVEVVLSLIDGVADAGSATAVGALFNVLPQLIPGSAVSGGQGLGAVLPIAVSLIEGTAFGTGTDATATGAVMPVTLSLIEGQATGATDATADGVVLPFAVSLIDGAAEGSGPESNGVTLTVTTSIVAGTATGGAAPEEGGNTTRFVSGMPFGPSVPVPPVVNARARGATIVVGLRLEKGSVIIDNSRTVEVEVVREVAAPPIVIQNVTVSGHEIIKRIILEAGVATGDAVAGGAVVDQDKDWRPYDAALMKLLEMA